MLSLAGDDRGKSYWIGRERASFKLAQSAASSEASLIHYDLAGRYSAKASSAETEAIDLASSLPRALNPARQVLKSGSVDDA